MKTVMLALALAALATGAVSTPAAAFPWDAGRFWHGAPEGLRERIDFLQRRIDASAANGSLSRGEAVHASDNLAGIRRLEGDMRIRNGGRLSEDNRISLEHKLDELSQRIKWERQTGW